MQKIGESIVIVRLFVQLVFSASLPLATFSLSPCQIRQCSWYASPPWKKHMFGLYATSALILVRSIFRVVEYLQGNNGYLLRKELHLYIFSAMLKLFVIPSFFSVHPSQITRYIEHNGNADGRVVVLSESQEWRQIPSCQRSRKAL